MSLFSHKAYDKLITMTGKSARWWAIAIFQLTKLNIKANPPCFQYVCARGHAKWHHKLRAERMYNAHVRNHLLHEVTSCIFKQSDKKPAIASFLQNLKYVVFWITNWSCSTSRLRQIQNSHVEELFQSIPINNFRLLCLYSRTSMV